MATFQANAKIFKTIEINDLLINLEVEANFGDLLDNNQIEIFNTLRKSIFFIL